MKCALCLNDSELCDSHIYPEFLYKEMYDDNHTFFLIENDPARPTKVQRKGIYEKILCVECERRIGKYEDYAAKVLLGGAKNIGFNLLPGKMVATNIDYQKFKLFEISLLWRSGVSRREEFQNVKFGKHSEIMRNMLFNEIPGEPYDYGCTLSFQPKLNDLMRGIISPIEPLPKKFMGFRIYRGILGGLVWAFVVSSNAQHFPHPELFLSKEGVLSIINSGQAGYDLFYSVVEQIHHITKKIK
jgi:hypothetical protein